jgi:hypothetical protein
MSWSPLHTGLVWMIRMELDNINGQTEARWTSSTGPLVSARIVLFRMQIISRIIRNRNVFMMLYRIHINVLCQKPTFITNINLMYCLKDNLFARMKCISYCQFVCTLIRRYEIYKQIPKAEDTNERRIDIWMDEWMDIADKMIDNLLNRWIGLYYGEDCVVLHGMHPATPSPFHFE